MSKDEYRHNFCQSFEGRNITEKKEHLATIWQNSDCNTLSISINSDDVNYATGGVLDIFYEYTFFFLPFSQKLSPLELIMVVPALL